MALKLAKTINAKVLGIVGKDGGYTAKVSDTVLIIPIVNDNSITPHTESFQALVWHLIVSHPKLKINQTVKLNHLKNFTEKKSNQEYLKTLNNLK